MAKQRYINTKFWSDNFVSELNPLDRYLFLYFLTNEHTNIAGIYELPLKTVSFETGLELDMLKKMIARLAGKVHYIDGWVYVANFQRHQYARSDNTNIIKGIEYALKEVPQDIKNKIANLSQKPIPLQAPSSLSDYSDSDIDIDLDIDLTQMQGEQARSDVNQVIDLFHEKINPVINYGNTTTRKAASALIQQFGLDSTLKLTRYAISVQGQDYAPVITTPYQLKEKLAQLKLFSQKNKQLIVKI